MLIKKNLPVVIYGSGNVAFHFGPALKQAGIEVRAVAGRNMQKVNELADRIQTEAIVLSDNKLPVFENSIHLICISDDFIDELAAAIKFREGIVVHTSGMTSLSVLSTHFKNAAVIYPLQSLKAEDKIDFYKEVPLLIEASNSETQDVIAFLAGKISSKQAVISSEERKKMHLAAVFANNFTNICFQAVWDLVGQEPGKIKLFKPLLEQTVKKAFVQEPRISMTGPAVRNNRKVIEAHLKILELKFPEYVSVYNQMTELIIKKINLK
jgi:predicted short-subunit dehydrogenase-like oxidoreductase (DUF2520 family)